MRIIEKPKVRGIKAQILGEGDFSVSLKPDIGLPASFNSIPGKYVDLTDVGTITVPFRIDVEAREWGIKGIMVSIDSSEIALEVVVNKSTPQGDSQEYTQRIAFDPSRIELQQHPGGAVTITGLILHLDENFGVDYEHSYFEVTTLMGEQ